MLRTRASQRALIRRHLTAGNHAAAIAAIDAYCMPLPERVARAAAPIWRLPVIRHATAVGEWGGRHARYTIPVAVVVLAVEIATTWR